MASVLVSQAGDQAGHFRRQVRETADGKVAVLTPVGGLDIFPKLVGDARHGGTLCLDERDYTGAVCGGGMGSVRGSSTRRAMQFRLLIVLLVQLKRLLPNKKGREIEESTKAKTLQLRLSRAESEKSQ